jgi:hypothetical protein
MFVPCLMSSFSTAFPKMSTDLQVRAAESARLGCTYTLPQWLMDPNPNPTPDPTSFFRMQKKYCFSHIFFSYNLTIGTLCSPQSTYFPRDETGLVCLPTQLERTYTAILLVMVNVMRGGGKHPPPSPARVNFTLMTECTPESSDCYSVYSVVFTLKN